MVTVTKDDDIRIIVDLTEDLVPVDLSQASNISAAITSRDGQQSYVTNLALDRNDPEADWANGTVVVFFPAANTGSLPTGVVRLEIQATRSGLKTTWYLDGVQSRHGSGAAPGDTTIVVTVTQNDDIRIVATLSEEGSPVDLSQASNISAAITNLEGTETFLEDPSLEEDDPEDDWANGKVVIIYPAADTGALPRGGLSLRIRVIRSGLQTTWFFDGILSRFGVLP